MKKKVRTQQSNPYYSSEPAVGRKQMADAPMTQSNFITNKVPKQVDRNPGRMSGIAGFASKGKPPTKPSGITVPKLGTKSGPPQQGKLKPAKSAKFKSKI